MRYFILFFLFFVFSLWGGEPEKADTPKVEAPKVEIPSNVKAFLDTYDQQMGVEKQRYLNLVLKLQKDLKVKLNNEIKVAEQKGKTELVTILTEKRKQLEENTVEDNFVALGFPGEAKKMNKKMLEDILESKVWMFVNRNNQTEYYIFKKGMLRNCVIKKVPEEKGETIKEIEKVGEVFNVKYLTDVQNQKILFSALSDTFSFSISEKEIQGLTNNRGGDIRYWKLVPATLPLPELLTTYLKKNP